MPRLGKFTNLILDEYATENFNFATEEEKPQFAPNPGSQADLFFNLLGHEKGEPQRIDYGDGESAIAYTVIPRPYSNQYKFILFRAGNGSGKSSCGAAFCYLNSLVYPHGVGLITANDYTQLAGSTLVALVRFCRDHGVKLEPDEGAPIEEVASAIARKKGCYIEGCYHYVRTAQDFLGETSKARQRGRGFEVGWSLCDEWLRVPSQSAFNTLLTRLRQQNTPCIGLLSSTINTDSPFNWGYSLFDSEERTEEQKQLFISVSGSTYENRHNLEKSYIPTLKASLTPELFRIEVLGEYVATTEGRIFKYFKRDTHLIELHPDPHREFHISVDFNWNPACAIIGQVDGQSLDILHEFYLERSDTFELSSAIAKYLIAHTRQPIIIHGDASGNQRTANSKVSNWQIVFETLQRYGLKTIRQFGDANPHIMDTVNATNVAFKNDNLFINKICGELTKDLETLKWKNDTIDKSDIKRSHLADCLRYIVHDLQPYTKPPQLKQGTWRM